MLQNYKFLSFGLASNRFRIIHYYHYLLLHIVAKSWSQRYTFVQAFKLSLAQATLDHEPFSLLSAVGIQEVPQH
jgi:hypothetical protein